MIDRILVQTFMSETMADHPSIMMDDASCTRRSCYRRPLTTDREVDYRMRDSDYLCMQVSCLTWGFVSIRPAARVWIGLIDPTLK